MAKPAFSRLMEWRRPMSQLNDILEIEQLDRYRSPLLTTLHKASSEDAVIIQLPPVATVHMPHYDLEQAHASLWLYPDPGPEHEYHDVEELSEEQQQGYRGEERSSGGGQPPSSAEPVQSKGQVRLPDNSIEFVSCNGPSGKRDAGSESKIRAHAMRRIHRQRRAIKEKSANLPNIAVDRSRTSKRCHCESARNRSCHGRSPPASQMTIENSTQNNLPKSAERAVSIVRPEMYGSTSKSAPTIIPTAPVVCKQCGRLQLLSWTADDMMAVAPYSVNPKDVLSTGDMDPFSSTVIPINHHMHELLQHCEEQSFDY
jgi:hypothetical protein